MLEPAARTFVKLTVADPLSTAKTAEPRRISPPSTTPFPLASAKTAAEAIPEASFPLPEAETRRLVTVTGMEPVLLKRT